jgi:hypothetical protein
VRLVQDALVRDPHRPDHEQTERSHEERPQVGGVDVRTGDVQTERHRREPPPILERHFGVEQGSRLLGHAGQMRRGSRRFPAHAVRHVPPSEEAAPAC